MAQDANKPQRDESDPAPQAEGAPIQERVQELTWAAIDDQISSDEMRLLDTLLLSDDAARKTYIGCVQLHTDLVQHFSPEPVGPANANVLGFLQGMTPPLGVPPTTEDSVS